MTLGFGKLHEETKLKAVEMKDTFLQYIDLSHVEQRNQKENTITEILLRKVSF